MSGSSVSRAPRPSRRIVLKRDHWTMGAGALAVAFAVAVSSFLLASPASAAPVSTARGAFLTGQALGLNLSGLLAIANANASNTGSPASVTQLSPLVAADLTADLEVAPGVPLLGAGGVLTLGAVNQYANAKSDGSSGAASGAVTDSGAIGAAGTNGVPASNATVRLGALIPAAQLGTLADVTVNVGALSATANQAAGANGAQTGAYRIGSLNITANSPLVGNIGTGLVTTVSGLQGTVNGLQATLNGLLGGLVTINNLPNVGNIVNNTLTVVTSADGSITANLKTGVVQIDVEKVLATAGLNINTLPANTDLLPYITAALTTQLLPAITTALTNTVTALTSAITNISATLLGIPVSLSVLTPLLNGLVTTVVAPVNATIAGLGATVITPLANTLTNVVALQANVKSTTGGVFTETALRVGVLPTLATPVASLNLASASVGPNAGPIPTTTGITPNHGPVAGGTTVTITGTNFTAGSTVSVDGGPAITPATIAPDGLSLTFVTPAHAAGPVPVTVTSSTGTSAPQTFTYDALPTATGLTPNNGPTAGGTSVTVTGTGFTPDARVSVDGGAPIVPTSIAANGQSLVFTTPAHAVGPVPVTVTTAGGTTAPQTFTYNPLPTLTSLAPTHGPVAGGTAVTITGTGFTAGSTVSVDGGPAITPTTIAANGLSLTFATPPHAAGPVTVTVTTPSGTTTAGIYTYDAAPTTTGIDPDNGPAAGGTSVTVFGTGFTDDATVSVDGGPAITPTDIAADGTSVTFITPAHPAGDVPVIVTTAAGTTGPQIFTYNPAPIPVPTAATLAPDNGPAAGGTTVTITGTGFTPDSIVTIDGVDVDPETVATNGNSLTFVTPAGDPGPVDVTVTTPGGTTDPLVFTYGPTALPAPTATDIDPDNGPTAGGTTVTITGTNFGPETTVSVDGGPAIIPVIGGVGTTLTFTTPPHAIGPVPVTVTTDAGTTGALTYTYTADPVISALAPDHGPLAGGTTVTITGTDFTPGTIVTIDGEDVTPASIAANGNSLTFVTPARIVAGPVDVTVTSIYGESDPFTYTYDADPIPAPTTDELDPDHGPAAGGTVVTITGENFTPDSVVSIDGGPGITPTTVAPDGTSLTFTTPAHIPGDTLVTVTTPTGTSPGLTFTFDPAPVAISLSPTSGPITGGTEVTIVGDNFTPASTVSVDGGAPITPTDISADGTELTFTTPAHGAGTVGVTVTTDAGTTAPLDFTYIGAPTAASLTPDNGPAAGETSVTITGTDFTAGSTVSVDGSAPITPDSIALDGLSLTFTTPAHAPGTVPVSVTTPSGTTAALPYTYNPAAVPAPTVTGIAPDNGPIAGGTLVTITGTNFTPDATVSVDGGAAITPASIATNGNSLTFITPAHTAGDVPVTVTTATGTAGPLTFTYGAPAPLAPTSTGIDPDNGPAAGNTLVTITGTNFTTGSTVSVDGGPAITPETIAGDGESLTFRTPAHAAGPVPVTVTNSAGTTAPQTFTYNAAPVPAPTTTGIAPSHGPAAGGTSVTITGTDFTPGSTVSVDGGPAITPDSVALNGNSLTFTTPAHAAGTVPVSVTTGNGTSNPQQFTFDPAPVPAPTATALAPDNGPTAGGTVVTITGTNFSPGATVSIDGGPAITPNSIAANGNSLTFTTPAHVAGPVDVTVTTATGETDPLVFTYGAPPVLAPTSTGIDPDNGPAAGGTSITITGTNFTAGSTVSVDGGPAIIPTDIAGDGTSLTFDTPAHPAGPVPVTVTTAAGTTAAQTFTYNAAPVPLPTTTGIAPSSGTTLGGTVVTITGTGFTPGSTVSIDGDTPFAADSVATNGNSLTFTTPAHAAGPVDVTVINSTGESGAQVFTFVAPAAPAPTASALDPDNGPAAGGITVTITGTNFTPDATVSVDGGPAITPDTIAGDGTSLTFTTPPHPAGDVLVTVTTATGTTDGLVFGYDAAPVITPTVTGLTPANGPAAGGTTVTITGTNFTPGSTVSIDGGTPIPADTINGTGTALTFTTPAHLPGDVTFTVTTDDGTTPGLVYTYDAAAPVAPTVTDIDPDNGPAAGGTSVTLTGTGFVPGSTVSIDGGPAITPTAINGTGTVLTFTTPAHVAGDVDVTVTTPGGTSGEVTFTYNAAPVVPTATTLNPDNGPAAGGTSVTITGTGFVPGSTVSIDGGPAITPTAINGTGTSLTFTTPPHAAGDVDITVTTPGGETDPLEFTYNAGPVTPPTATSLAPDNGPAAGGTSVTITGTGFVAGTTVSVDGGPAITPTSINGAGTVLTFNTPAHAPGDVDVTVTNPGGESDPLEFTYNAVPTPAPTITDLDPDNGPAAGGTTVTITGTNFTPGTTVSVDGGPAITPTSINGAGTELTFVTPAHAAGDVPVSVTTGAGTSGALTYTYNPAPTPAPTVTGLAPSTGPVEGGTTVTVTGENFTPGSIVTIDGTEVTPASVAANGNSLTFVTPAHPAGEVDVSVTTGAGTSGDLPFTYTAAPVLIPMVTDIDPDNGPAAGGDTVTITGTNFTPGTTVSVDGGPAITPSSINGAGTELTFVTPAHDAGDVPVSVTNDDGTSAAVTYTYNPAAVPAPTITALAPNHGPIAGGTTVTITGNNFTADSVVTIDGEEVEPDSVATNGNSLTFTTPEHDAGDVTVTVTTGSGTTAGRTYTYDPLVVPAPTIDGLSPNSGPVAGGTSVTITGTGFTADSVVTIDGEEVEPDSVDGDGESLTFTTPDHVAGPVTVTVTTEGGTTAGRTFTYVPAAVPAPVITSIAPDNGPIEGGTVVTIIGTGFGPGTTVTIDGEVIVPDSISPDGTTLTFTTPDHDAEVVDVSVTSPDGGESNTVEYTYDPDDASPLPDPTITAPGDGDTVSDDTPEIRGTGNPGDDIVVTEDGTVICETTVGSSGRWACTPDEPLGQGEHTIVVTETDADGQEGTATVSFTVDSDLGGDGDSDGDGDGDGNGNGSGNGNGNNGQNGGGLAATGLDVALPSTISVSLLIAGLLLMLRRRRRGEVTD